MKLNWSFWSGKHTESKEPENTVNDKVRKLNKNYSIFGKISDEIEQIVSSRSVVDKNIINKNNFSNPVWETAIDNDVTVLPLCSNKQERLTQYRTISRFPECDWCLDEICDDFIHEDENGDIIKLTLPDGKENINDTRKDIIQNEFKKYMDLFNLKDNGFNLIKKFLIDGELCWENIIKHDKPELGIIGVKFLQTEYYNTLIDSKTNKPIGIYFDLTKYNEEQRKQLTNMYYSNSSQVFSTVLNTIYTTKFNENDSIVFLWPQLTYISSGEYSDDGLVIYSLIEKTKQAYHQLALIQDAAVIMRVTRAPERLLFNVSTGKMNQHTADEYVRRFATSLKSKKIATTNETPSDIASVYNPPTLLESYIFGKSDGNDGTSIESVGSSASYDEMDDVEYFLRRLLKQFKIPFSRYKTPENTMERNETITYEEYSFCRMIVRLQRRFAKGFKKGFITHLKLRDIWDKYELTDSDIDINFIKPVLMDLYQSNKLLEAKVNMYKTVKDNDELSKITAMKKILNFTEDDIEENFKNLAKEKMYMQLADYWSNKINENGPVGVLASPPLPIKGLDKYGNPIKSDDNDTDGDSGGESSDDSGSTEGGTDAGGTTEAPSFGLG